jgi:hypothetical protein
MRKRRPSLSGSDTNSKDQRRLRASGSTNGTVRTHCPVCGDHRQPAKVVGIMLICLGRCRPPQCAAIERRVCNLTFEISVVWFTR